MKLEGKETEEELEDHWLSGYPEENWQTFYVSTNIIDPKSWVVLPQVTSKQIR